MTSTGNEDFLTIICNDEIFKRTSFACGVYQARYIVIAGGRKNRKEVNSAAMYDVTTQTSVALPDLPFAGFCKGVVLNDYFYVTNGSSGLQRICLSKRQKWEFVIKHEEIENVALHVLTDGNHVFLIDIVNNQITIFNPSNNKLTSIKGSRRHRMNILAYRNMDPSDAVLMDNKIYIMTYGKMFIYDIANGLWIEASPLPKPLQFSFCDPALVVIDRWIVTTAATPNYIVIYDTHTQQWTQANNTVLLPCASHNCVKVGSHIITLGGLNYNDLEYCPMTSIHIKHIMPDREWIMLKHYILLRKLVDDNRAAPSNERVGYLLAGKIIDDDHAHPLLETNQPKQTDSDMKVNADANKNADAIVEKLFTDMPLEIFRYILMFLK